MTRVFDKEVHQLAAMTYGESSAQNNEGEMFAIASVLVRQRDARGFSDIITFATKDRTFSFVTNDGNPRYRKFMAAKYLEIERDTGMSMAVRAAENALKGGVDKSNGAYFWDGVDIKTNYKNHFKVRHGIKFTDPLHNIYDIKESSKTVIIYKTTKIRNKATGKTTSKRDELARYDHQYESTNACGGTIFWRFSRNYIDATHAWEYK